MSASNTFVIFIDTARDINITPRRISDRTLDLASYTLQNETYRSALSQRCGRLMFCLVLLKSNRIIFIRRLNRKREKELILITNRISLLYTSIWLFLDFFLFPTYSLTTFMILCFHILHLYFTLIECKIKRMWICVFGKFFF